MVGIVMKIDSSKPQKPGWVPLVQSADALLEETDQTTINSFFRDLERFSLEKIAFKGWAEQEKVLKRILQAGERIFGQGDRGQLPDAVTKFLVCQLGYDGKNELGVAQFLMKTKWEICPNELPREQAGFMIVRRQRS